MSIRTRISARRISTFTAVAGAVVVASSLLPAQGASASPLGATFVNNTTVVNSSNFTTKVKVHYQLRERAAKIVTAINRADATTVGCHDCDTAGVAFQVVVVNKNRLKLLNADNSANAISQACTRCNTLALAYQIIIADDSVNPLNRHHRAGLAALNRSLNALRGLPFDQMQAQADALAQQAVDSLRSTAPDQGVAQPVAGRDFDPSRIVELHRFLDDVPA
jgi:hypothetical protein